MGSEIRGGDHSTVDDEENADLELGEWGRRTGEVAA